MNIDMLFCIVLMVLGAFLIYYPIKDESPRQKLKKLADSVASDKKDIDYLIQRSATFWITWRQTMGKVRL